MKKVLVVAVMLGAGLAYASTLGVPWFVDNAPTGANPPLGAGTMGIIFIHNNHSEALEVTVAYYTAVGNYIGPDTGNTFSISPQASLGFRPVADDTAAESAAARLIPNRPRTTDPPSNTNNDGKANGSLVFEWMGPAEYLTGYYSLQKGVTRDRGPTDTTQIYKLYGYAHLL